MPKTPIPDHVFTYLLDYFGDKHRSDIEYIADHYQGRFTTLDEFFAARVRECAGEAAATMSAEELQRRLDIHRETDPVFDLDAPADEHHPPGVWVFLFPERD